MATTESEIKQQIRAHIDEEGSTYDKWYVGITNNGKRRLGEHNIDVEGDEFWWITRMASTDEIARRIEKHFINLGTDGGDGGGDESSKVVYAYKKTSITKP